MRLPRVVTEIGAEEEERAARVPALTVERAPEVLVMGAALELAMMSRIGSYCSDTKSERMICRDDDHRPPHIFIHVRTKDKYKVVRVTTDGVICPYLQLA